MGVLSCHLGVALDVPDMAVSEVLQEKNYMGGVFSFELHSLPVKLDEELDLMGEKRLTRTLDHGEFRSFHIYLDKIRTRERVFAYIVIQVCQQNLFRDGFGNLHSGRW